MHATHHEPGSAALLTLPPGTREVIERNHCLLNYSVLWQETAEPWTATVLMNDARPDDFGTLQVSQPYPYGLSINDDTHETIDCDQAWDAYLQQQYPLPAEAARSHPKPKPLTAAARSVRSCKPSRLAQLEALARRVARLNRDAGEIGAGMLASLVDDARRALGEVTA